MLQLHSFEKSPGGQGIYRAAMVVAFAAFVYWAYSQPTEFDNLMAAQKQFMHDLYEGNLLADVAQVGRSQPPTTRPAAASERERC